MADRREQVLLRLMELAASTPGIISTHRNSLSLDETELPAFVLLDGDEEADVLPPRDGRAPPGYAPSLITLLPEMYLMDGPLADEENVGSSINELRAAFLKLVLEDATLRSITGPNGSIRYRGCNTGLSVARSMQGECSVLLTFTYPLIVTEL